MFTCLPCQNSSRIRATVKHNIRITAAESMEISTTVEWNVPREYTQTTPSPNPPPAIQRLCPEYAESSLAVLTNLFNDEDCPLLSRQILILRRNRVYTTLSCFVFETFMGDGLCSMEWSDISEDCSIQKTLCRGSLDSSRVRGLVGCVATLRMCRGRTYNVITKQDGHDACAV